MTPRYFIFIPLFFALGFSESCSKNNASKDTTNHADTTDLLGKNKPSDFSNTETCNHFFQTLQDIDNNYIEKSTVSRSDRLNKSFKNFTSEIINSALKIEPSDIDNKPVTWNDCSRISELASRIKTNSNLVNFFSDKKMKFDAEEFVREFIIKYYTNSYDRFSDFDGPYTRIFSGNSYEATLPWGLRLLDRPDYYYGKPLEEDKNKNYSPRKPQYLYVEYSPAYLRKKLPEKTRIYQIDNVDVSDMTYNESLKKISEVKDQKTTLTISRWDKNKKSYEELQTVDVKFKIFDAKQTSFELIQPTIAYIRIAQFKQELNNDLFKTLNDFRRLYNGNLNGTILDLRTNYGGKSYELQKIFETIFPDVETVFGQQTSRKSTAEYVQESEKTEDTNNIDYGKIVVLVDFRSASAAEALVAALKDYSAALVVGEKTRGKGIGQSTSGNGSFETTLTNFYIFSPAGKSWYLEGISPDIEVLEPANENYVLRLDREKNSLPSPYSGTLNVEFDPTSVEIKNRITQPILNQLKDFKKTTPDPDECKSKNEEDSCIKAWGLKILEKWIELEPTVN